MELLLLNQTIIVPDKIGHGYKPVEMLDMSLLYKEPFSVHRRLKVFATRGLLCYRCEKRQGIYLIKAHDFHGNTHVDIYTEDFHLMTVDHFIPKCEGGTDNIQNLFPCCNRCNSKKGRKIITMCPQQVDNSNVINIL